MHNVEGSSSSSIYTYKFKEKLRKKRNESIRHPHIHITQAYFNHSSKMSSAIYAARRRNTTEMVFNFIKLFSCEERICTYTYDRHICMKAPKTERVYSDDHRNWSLEFQKY